MDSSKFETTLGAADALATAFKEAQKAHADHTDAKDRLELAQQELQACYSTLSAALETYEAAKLAVIDSVEKL